MARTVGRVTAFKGATFIGILSVLMLVGCTQPPAPAENRPSPDSVQVLEKFSDRMLNAGAPAVVVQIKVNGDVWSRASGVRDLESRTPAEVSDPVEVASLTKSMVAVSVMKLVEEGRVRLDDPVGKYIAEFDKVMKPPGPVTVRQLLRQESGMPSYDGALIATKPVQEALMTSMSLSENMALAAKLPWTVSGRGFEYSNSNYIVLGLLLERLRGLPIAEILRTDIAEPLGLSGTRLAGPGPAPATMIHGYITIAGQRVDVTYPGGLVGNSAAGLVSTVGDINTFYAALLNGQLLKSETVKEMQVSPSGLYASGLFVGKDACTNRFYYGHRGDWAGYGTMAMISADGKRQLALTLAYPPGPFDTSANAPSNPLAWDVWETAEIAFNHTC